MISHIPELVRSGVDSLKIEGRMKSVLYVATTARAYRQAIDDYFKSGDEYRQRMKWYEREVAACTNRTFTTGFFFGKPSYDSMIYDESTYVTDYTFLGFVDGTKSTGGMTCYRMMQRNKFSVGDEVEIMRPGGDNEKARVLHLYDEEGNIIDSVPHAKQIFYIDTGVCMDEFAVLRRKETTIRGKQNGTEV